MESFSDSQPNFTALDVELKMTVSGLQLAKARELALETVQTKAPMGTRMASKMVVAKLVVTKMAVDSKREVTKPVVTRMAVDSKTVVIKPVVTRTVVIKPEVTRTVVARTLGDSKMPHRQALLASPNQRALLDNKTQLGLTLVETPVGIELTTNTVAVEETSIRTCKGTKRASSSHEDRYLLKRNPRSFQGLMT